MNWVSIKEKGLPSNEDNLKYYCFAKWYEPWQQWTNEEVMMWRDIKAFRDYDLKNEYSHYIELPSRP